MVILTLLPSAGIGGPPDLTLETRHPERSSENLSTSWSITACSRALHRYLIHYYRGTMPFKRIGLMKIRRKGLGGKRVQHYMI